MGSIPWWTNAVFSLAAVIVATWCCCCTLPASAEPIVQTQTTFTCKGNSTSNPVRFVVSGSKTPSSSSAVVVSIEDCQIRSGILVSLSATWITSVSITVKNSNVSEPPQRTLAFSLEMDKSTPPAAPPKFIATILNSFFIGGASLMDTNRLYTNFSSTTVAAEDSEFDGLQVWPNSHFLTQNFVFSARRCKFAPPTSPMYSMSAVKLALYRAADASVVFDGCVFAPKGTDLRRGLISFVFTEARNVTVVMTRNVLTARPGTTTLTLMSAYFVEGVDFSFDGTNRVSYGKLSMHYAIDVAAPADAVDPANRVGDRRFLLHITKGENVTVHVGPAAPVYTRTISNVDVAIVDTSIVLLSVNGWLRNSSLSFVRCSVQGVNRDKTPGMQSGIDTRVEYRSCDFNFPANEFLLVMDSATEAFNFVLVIANSTFNVRRFTLKPRKDGAQSVLIIGNEITSNYTISMNVLLDIDCGAACVAQISDNTFHTVRDGMTLQLGCPYFCSVAGNKFNIGPKRFVLSAWGLGALVTMCSNIFTGTNKSATTSAVSVVVAQGTSMQFLRTNKVVNVRGVEFSPKSGNFTFHLFSSDVESHIVLKGAKGRSLPDTNVVLSNVKTQRVLLHEFLFGNGTSFHIVDSNILDAFPLQGTQEVCHVCSFLFLGLTVENLWLDRFGELVDSSVVLQSVKSSNLRLALKAFFNTTVFLDEVTSGSQQQTRSTSISFQSCHYTTFIMTRCNFTASKLVMNVFIVERTSVALMRHNDFAAWDFFPSLTNESAVYVLSNSISGDFVSLFALVSTVAGSNTTGRLVLGFNTFRSPVNFRKELPSLFYGNDLQGVTQLTMTSESNWIPTRNWMCNVQSGDVESAVTQARSANPGEIHFVEYSKCFQRLSSTTVRHVSFSMCPNAVPLSPTSTQKSDKLQPPRSTLEFCVPRFNAATAQRASVPPPLSSQEKCVAELTPGVLVRRMSPGSSSSSGSSASGSGSSSGGSPAKSHTQELHRPTTYTRVLDPLLASASASHTLTETFEAEDDEGDKATLTEEHDKNKLPWMTETMSHSVSSSVRAPPPPPPAKQKRKKKVVPPTAAEAKEVTAAVSTVTTTTVVGAASGGANAVDNQLLLLTVRGLAGCTSSGALQDLGEQGSVALTPFSFGSVGGPFAKALGLAAIVFAAVGLNLLLVLLAPTLPILKKQQPDPQAGSMENRLAFGRFPGLIIRVFGVAFQGLAQTLAFAAFPAPTDDGGEDDDGGGGGSPKVYQLGLLFFVAFCVLLPVCFLWMFVVRSRVMSGVALGQMKKARTSERSSDVEEKEANKTQPPPSGNSQPIRPLRYTRFSRDGALAFQPAWLRALILPVGFWPTYTARWRMFSPAISAIRDDICRWQLLPLLPYAKAVLVALFASPLVRDCTAKVWLLVAVHAATAVFCIGVRPYRIGLTNVSGFVAGLIAAAVTLAIDQGAVSVALKLVSLAVFTSVVTIVASVVLAFKTRRWMKTEKELCADTTSCSDEGDGDGYDDGPSYDVVDGAEDGDTYDGRAGCRRHPQRRSNRNDDSHRIEMNSFVAPLLTMPSRDDEHKCDGVEGCDENDGGDAVSSSPLQRQSAGAALAAALVRDAGNNAESRGGRRPHSSASSTAHTDRRSRNHHRSGDTNGHHRGDRPQSGSSRRTKPSSSAANSHRSAGNDGNRGTASRVSRSAASRRTATGGGGSRARGASSRRPKREHNKKDVSADSSSDGL